MGGFRSYINNRIMPEVHYKNQTVTGNDAASYVAYVPPIGVSV